MPLLTEEIYLGVPPGHRLAGREWIHLNEAAEETFVALEKGAIMRDYTDEFCRQAGFVPNVAFEGDEPSTIKGLIGAGLGVGFVPALSWLSYQNESELSRPARLRIKEPHCQRTIALAWRETRYLSHAARAFRDFVVAYFQSLADEVHLD
jgi:DNA-binding transcriptional LysR family regulator